MRRLLAGGRALLLSGRFWFGYHAAWGLVWLVTFPLAMSFWRESVPYLMFVSQATALSGALAGMAGALAVRHADPEDELS